MKIEDLQETAALAHLNLTKDELAGAFPAFEQMLGYFAAMQAADEDTAAFGGPLSAGESARTAASGHFRPDHAVPSAASLNNPSNSLNENLLNNAGERDGRFVVVPNVL